MDSAVEVNPTVGIVVVAAAALNGIAVVRAYLHLFAGARHVSTVWLGIGTRERIAVLTLAAMILGGGLFPQPGVTTRELAAEEILKDRESRAQQAGRTEQRKPSPVAASLLLPSTARQDRLSRGVADASTLVRMNREVRLARPDSRSLTATE